MWHKNYFYILLHFVTFLQLFTYLSFDCAETTIEEFILEFSRVPSKVVFVVKLPWTILCDGGRFCKFDAWNWALSFIWLNHKTNRSEYESSQIFVTSISLVCFVVFCNSYLPFVYVCSETLTCNKIWHYDYFQGFKTITYEYQGNY